MNTEAVAGETKVYGWSDDLIEMDGVVDDEQYAIGSDPERLGLEFDDGTVLAFRYVDSGVWRAEIVKRGSAQIVVEIAPDDDEDDYSDVVTLTGVTRLVRTFDPDKTAPVS